MTVAQDIINGPDATPMRVLIVESQTELGALWQKHLERCNMKVHNACTQDDATNYLRDNIVDIVVLDLVLSKGAALAVSDYAQYCQPDAQVIFVTNTSFFSDGSIFAHASNARAFVPSDTPPDDLAAMIEHYGAAAR